MKKETEDPEWELFKEWARKFPDNPPEKRYGIVDPSAVPPFTEKDMLYSDCPRKLHHMHFDRYPTVVLRRHIDWLERAEGKKPSGYFSIQNRI